MGRTKSRGQLRMGDDVRFSTQRKRQAPVVLAESIALLLYILGSLLTLHFTLQTPMGLPVYLGAVCASVLFTAVYRYQRYRFPILVGSLLLTGILLDSVIKATLWIFSSFLNAVNENFHTNIPVRHQDYSESEVTALLLVFILLSAILLGYGIVTRRTVIFHIIASIPFLWMAVNLREKTLLSGVLLLLLSTLMVLTMRSGDLRVHAPPANGNFAEGIRRWGGSALRTHVMDNPHNRQEAFLHGSLAMLGAALTISLALGAILPRDSYVWNESLAEFNQAPVKTMRKITSQLGRVGLPAAAGIGTGELGKIGALTYQNQLHLQIETLSHRKPMYLKGSVSSVYTGSEWKGLPESVYQENRQVFENLEAARVTPMTFSNSFHRSMLSKSIWEIDPDAWKKEVGSYRKGTGQPPMYMEGDLHWMQALQEGYPDMAPPMLNRIKITNVNADPQYLYSPYFLFTDLYGSTADTIRQSAEYVYDTVLRDNSLLGQRTYELRAYQYFPEDPLLHEIFRNKTGITPDHLNFFYRAFEKRKTLLSAIDGYREFVYANYLQLPEQGMERLLLDYHPGMFNGYELSMPAPGTEYLYIEKVQGDLNKLAYNLSPGATPAGKDFVDDFLYEKKQGYCVHFASAATLMFRAMGIPARYVEGYVVTEGDYTSNTTADIYDRNAHAWTEIYQEPYGWIPVEVTPGFGGQGIAGDSLQYPTDLPETSSSGSVSSEEASSIGSSSEEGGESQPSSSESTAVPPEESELPESDREQGGTVQSEPEPPEGSGGNGASGENGSSGESPFTAIQKVWAFLLPALRWLLPVFGGLLGVAMTVTGGLWLWRKWSLARLKRELSQKNRNQAAIAAYRYLLRLLRFAGLAELGEPEPTEAAEAKADALSPACREELKRAMEIILEARFGQGELGEEKLTELLGFLSVLETAVFEALDPIGKLRYRFWACLREGNN